MAFLNEDGAVAIRERYDVNDGRLAAIKARYDPDTLVRHNETN